MCILLCFMEYNEKSRLGTTYPDELFKNAVAAIYKATAAHLSFFVFSYTPLFIIIIIIIIISVCDVREYIYRCRVESTSGVVKRTVFFLARKSVLYRHTPRAHCCTL